MIIAMAINNKMTGNNLDLELYWIINPYRCRVGINETAVINRNGIMVKALILLLLIGSYFTELNHFNSPL